MPLARASSLATSSPATCSPTASWPPAGPGLWVIDLDGVVWLAGEPIAGAADAIKDLRANGNDVLFATNNASPTVSELLARLARAGILAGPDDLVTSAQAAAALVESGWRVLPLADRGVFEALEARPVTIVDRAPADAVVVGWTRHFDFEGIARAMRAVRDGARLIGTNEDPTHPTPDGLLPGSGALLAAVATASGAVPLVAGKPHEPFASLVRSVASDRGLDIVAVVGDRPSTDGLLAHELGAPYALVLSGVTAAHPAGEAGRGEHCESGKKDSVSLRVLAAGESRERAVAHFVGDDLAAVVRSAPAATEARRGD